MSLKDAAAVILDCRRVGEHHDPSPALHGSGDGDLGPDGHLVGKLRQRDVLQCRNGPPSVLCGEMAIHISFVATFLHLMTSVADPP